MGILIAKFSKGAWIEGEGCLREGGEAEAPPSPIQNFTMPICGSSEAFTEKFRQLIHNKSPYSIELNNKGPETVSYIYVQPHKGSKQHTKS